MTLPNETLLALGREIFELVGLDPDKHLDSVLLSVAAIVAKKLDAARWQPIETAPKDGTEILAYNKHGGTGTMLVRYIAPSDFLTDTEIEAFGLGNNTIDEPDWFAADFVQGDRLSPDCVPTRWMPTPRAPEQ